MPAPSAPRCSCPSAARAPPAPRGEGDAAAAPPAPAPPAPPAPRRREAPVTPPIRPGWPTFFGVAPVLDPATAKANVIFLGVPFDQGTNDRPGARFGPLALREA